MKRLALWVAAAAIVAVLAGTWLAYRSIMDRAWSSTTDEIASVGDVLSAAILILAAMAALVALAAYGVSIRDPHLKTSVRFRFSHVANRASLVVDPNRESPPGFIGLALFRQLEATVEVDNTARWSARNPAVRISLNGITGLKDQAGWSIVSRANQVGISAIQWNGGADLTIHGRWKHVLPGLDFDGCFVTATGKPRLHVEVVAEGFRDDFEVVLEPVAAKDWTGPPKELIG